jgi:hypothetical protein
VSVAPETAESLRRRIFNVVGAATWQMEQLLGVLDIVVDSTVPTAAVECRVTPRLLINTDFVRQHCVNDEALFMLILHELYHVVLGHTRLFDRPTLAHNVAFDAVINAMLCQQFRDRRYVQFFEEINPPDRLPGRLLRPPCGWPGKMRFASDASEAEKRVLTLLYGPAQGGATYLEIFRLLVELWDPDWHKSAVFLGNHSSGASTGTANPLLTDILARIVGEWPRPPLNLGGRDQGGEARSWMLEPPAQPSAPLSNALRDLLRRAGFILGAQGGPRRPAVATSLRLVESVLIQPRDRRIAAWRALHGVWPVLYRSEAPYRSLRPVPQPVAHVYLDVSGSMFGILPALGGALAEPHRLGLVRVFAFSTVVDEVRPGGLHRHAVWNTLGTDVNCVLRHMMDLPARRRPRSVVLLTDGWVGVPETGLLETLRHRRTRILAGIPPAGHTPELAELGAEITELPL